MRGSRPDIPGLVLLSRPAALPHIWSFAAAVATRLFPGLTPSLDIANGAAGSAEKRKAALAAPPVAGAAVAVSGGRAGS